MLRTLFFLLIFVSGAAAQNSSDIKPPAEDLSRTELEKWIVQALGKYGEYKSQSMNASVSSAKFTGCTLNFDIIRKSTPRHNDTVNAVYKTRGVKHPVSIDLSRVAAISVVDYLNPELQTVVLTMTGGPTTNGSEIIVRHAASNAIKTAFERMRGFCVGTK
ncbi:MAG TPA: hypothetical protein VNA22_08650 [Pyrinomonadaceae bacterium]|nr:hypothetical protein [Pyrinomonadaceae bacterium]